MMTILIGDDVDDVDDDDDDPYDLALPGNN